MGLEAGCWAVALGSSEVMADVQQASNMFNLQSAGRSCTTWMLCHRGGVRSLCITSPSNLTLECRSRTAWRVAPSSSAWTGKQLEARVGWLLLGVLGQLRRACWWHAAALVAPGHSSSAWAGEWLEARVCIAVEVHVTAACLGCTQHLVGCRAVAGLRRLQNACSLQARGGGAGVASAF